MSNLSTLVPAEVEATTLSYKRFGVAFGDRFFLLLLLGLLWIIPAFVDLRFVYALLAWDGFVILTWLGDLAQLPNPSKLTVRRTWRSAVALSTPSDVYITLSNSSDKFVRATVIDTVPVQLRNEPPTLALKARGRGEATATYRICPVQRGDVNLGDCYVRYQSVLHIAERWVRGSLPQTVRIYPNLEDAKRHSIFLLRSRQIVVEKRRSRMRGIGREFESLREYRQGDEYRDICWTAAARRGKLVTRVHQIERSQTVWIVIDSGRLMRARVGGFSKLDHAVNSALSLAQVALYSGDRVGLVAYGRAIRQQLPADKGSTHLRQFIEQLALVHEEVSEADHLHMAGRLLTDQKRRSLIVWLTDLAETAMTPEVIEAAAMMMPKHLVLFVVIGQPDLGELARKRPESETEMYQVAAAQEMVHRRELLLARLRERGALALEVDSGAISPALVSSYLQIKERNQL